MNVLHLDPRRLTALVLTPPVSKSDALRVLMLEHAFGRPLSFSSADPALPEDVRRLRAGLARLEESGAGNVTIDCGDGGAPFRFLLALTALTPGSDVALTGSARLAERPHGPLMAALREVLTPAGGAIEPGAPWPVRVRGPRTAPAGARLRIDAAASSQFASALLLAASAASRREGHPWTVHLAGAVASRGYLELTRRWMRSCGIALSEADGAIHVDATHPWRTPPPVPTDWSSAAYLLLIAWRTGAHVSHLAFESPHPDRAIVQHLHEVGLHVEESAGTRGTVTVRGSPRGGLRASATQTPDLIPTLAALACVLPEPSRFTGTQILRHKESDRVEGIRSLVTAFGGDVQQEGDELIVYPAQTSPPHVTLDAAGDHRRALTAAALSVLTGVPLTLSGADSVRKSFPTFFQGLGVAPGTC